MYQICVESYTIISIINMVVYYCCSECSQIKEYNVASNGNWCQWCCMFLSFNRFKFNFQGINIKLCLHGPKNCNPGNKLVD